MELIMKKLNEFEEKHKCNLNIGKKELLFIKSIFKELEENLKGYEKTLKFNYDNAIKDSLTYESADDLQLFIKGELEGVKQVKMLLNI